MKQPLTEIITIGDEILYGQIVDTNSQWISKELDNIGIRTIRKTTVADTEADILSAFAEASGRADIILITGGLGPTHDDLTKPCLAKFFGSEITLNQQALEEVKSIFEKIGRPLTETNKQQAYLPINCQVVTNRAGTAPGMWFNENGKIFVSMPGVPHEMKTMMTEQILPRLGNEFNTPSIYHKIVKTIGLGESWLSDQLKPWEKQLPNHIKLAFLPGLGEVKLRLTAVGSNIPVLEEEVAQQIKMLHESVGKYIYGYDKDTLPRVVGGLLRKMNLNIATAESCTGGKVAHLLTSVAGSSDYFIGSIVAYQNRLKESMLDVNPETIENHGAVSEQTVIEMANGVRSRLNSNIGIATSGIAGPGGGTPEKPVGTVWIACADERETVAKRLNLFKDRAINIELTAKAVLNLVRQRLQEMDGEKS
jgi:nicotinamide-nucleotide amidase